jgi:hypothetical protein
MFSTYVSKVLKPLFVCFDCLLHNFSNFPNHYFHVVLVFHGINDFLNILNHTSKHISILQSSR